MNSDRVAMLSGAFFLFGLAILISLGMVWPGILLLIAMAAVPILWVEEGWRMTLWLVTQAAIWLGGIPLLLEIGWLWPGILVLAGTSALVMAFVNPDTLQQHHRAEQELAKRKRKQKREPLRDIPVPPLDDDDILELLPFQEEDDDDHAPRRARR